MDNLLASKEHYISSANTYDGQDLKLFQSWLDDIVRQATVSGKTQTDIAISTSRGPYINMCKDALLSIPHANLLKQS